MSEPRQSWLNSNVSGGGLLIFVTTFFVSLQLWSMYWKKAYNVYIKHSLGFFSLCSFMSVFLYSKDMQIKLKFTKNLYYYSDETKLIAEYPSWFTCLEGHILMIFTNIKLILKEFELNKGILFITKAWILLMYFLCSILAYLSMIFIFPFL